MKKNTGKYTCYVTLTATLLTAVLGSVACSGPEMPKMTVSYGPEIGFADGNVNLTGSEPIINISDIRAEIGMNIDYLSGVVVQNEEDFTDLEIRVDASMVDIFTPGNYKVVYTFLFNDNMVSKEITVTLFESEQSASESISDVTSKPTTNTNNNTTNRETSTTVSNTSTNNDISGTTKPNTTTSSNTGTTTPDSTTSSNTSTTKPNPTTSSNTGTTRPNPTTSNNIGTTKPNPTTSSNIGTTKPNPTTNNNTSTTKPDDTSTTREIITTTGDQTTELKNLGNYTIELLSGKTITIKNTTKRYIVSTRTDVEIVEENGYTYRISKLIITYNTGFGQILETIKDRIK